VDRGRLFTIGHSTRSLAEFLDLLDREGVRHLVDVRAFPASRRYPHFSKENLEHSLVDKGIRYTHFPELGGRRRANPDSRNTLWRNAGFRAYADYMETDGFEAGLAGLLRLAGEETTAVMCAEAVPWRCHRTLISDAAEAQGIQVFHILDSATTRHSLTAFARVENSRVRYDTHSQPGLFES
jgi:uncharacterized protein (DUF488 family)